MSLSDDQKYEISEDELGWDQFKKIDQGVDLQFSFTPSMVLYRVERR